MATLFFDLEGMVRASGAADGLANHPAVLISYLRVRLRRRALAGWPAAMLFRTNPGPPPEDPVAATRYCIARQARQQSRAAVSRIDLSRCGRAPDSDEQTNRVKEGAPAGIRLRQVQ